LRARAGEFEDPKAWEEQVEQPLQKALAEAVEGLDWPEERARRYVASATAGHGPQLIPHRGRLVPRRRGVAGGVGPESWDGEE